MEWSKDEVNTLLEMRKQGRSYKEISKRLGRTAEACKSKIHNMSPKRKQYKKEYDKKYYRKNKDQIAEQHKKHYEDNKDKYLEYFKQYREDNKEYFRQYFRNYFAQNPSVRQRYENEFSHRFIKFEDIKGKCELTGYNEKQYDLELHHIIPVKDNKEFWDSCSIEVMLDNTIVLCKPLHKDLHNYCGYKNYSEKKFYDWLDQLTEERIEEILSDWDLRNNQATLDKF